MIQTTLSIVCVHLYITEVIIGKGKTSIAYHACDVEKTTKKIGYCLPPVFFYVKGAANNAVPGNFFLDTHGCLWVICYLYFMATSRKSLTDRPSIKVRAIRALLNGSWRISPALAGRLCYQVLAVPPRRLPDAAEAQFLALGQPAFFTLDDMQVSTYHWPGTGPTVLLAHGWDSHSGRWYELGQQLLAAGYDVYAVDAPAHGQTQGGHFSVIYYAEVLATFVDQCQPAVVVGHSAGGMAAVYYLHHHQQAHRPQQLVLLATPGELNDFMNSFRMGLGVRQEVIDEVEEGFIRRYQHQFSYYSISRFSQELTIPGLIIHDHDDDVAPIAGAHDIAANWTNSELILTEGLGHSLKAAIVWHEIMDFIGRFR